MTAFGIVRLAEELLAAAVGTVAFSVLFFVPRKYYILCGGCGAVAWLVYSLFVQIGISPAESTFYATLAVIVLARLFAVCERCPATLFLIPGIFPLVPGAGVYWTAYHIVTNDLKLAQQTGFAALKAAVAIVLGIIFVFELPQGFFRYISFALRRLSFLQTGGRPRQTAGRRQK